MSKEEQHIGYRYDVNLSPDPNKITPFLKRYLELMGWQDLNWLEDVHMGFEEGKPAVFDRNINGWVTVPEDMKLPKGQQERDMLALRTIDKVPNVQASSAVSPKESLRKNLSPFFVFTLSVVGKFLVWARPLSFTTLLCSDNK